MDDSINRFDRQSFLGINSDATLAATTIGLVGLGGGGSHFAQLLSLIGIGGYINCDPDFFDFPNLNRHPGGTIADAKERRPKVAIAERVIRGSQPDARIFSHEGTWHEVADQLKQSDIILGAVDSFSEREQLERFARRYLIPYIDIGADVILDPSGGFFIFGQIILSVPGAPCLRCCNFITDDNLAKEAQKYGAAGGRPQVIWPNGVLANTAVSLMMKILTPWNEFPLEFKYLELDGNRDTVTPSFWVQQLAGKSCQHHPADETGDPLFDSRRII